MIEFKYIKPTVDTPFGRITVNVNEPILGVKFPYKLPLTLKVISQVSNKVVWSCELGLNHWASYTEPVNHNFEVVDSSGIMVSKWSWDTIQHGDELHKVFYSWCLQNKNANGIAIGTHNGETGEWVIPIKEGLVNGILVEASEKQFNELVNNYDGYKNVKTIKTLVTVDGNEYDFYENENSCTNSILKDHSDKYGSIINTVKMSSISLNDLIINNGLEKNCKWLHLDVEGIDSDLILSLDETKINLPEVILYESLNMTDDVKLITKNFLESKGYKVQELNGWNTLAIKTNELSLLIQTCDNYEWFWSGIFCTLDLYWDFKYPVYFASEEKNPHNLTYHFDSNYKPNPNIISIQHIKSENSDGFSTRMIDALNKIDSKYVLYIQEDMWLRRGINSSTIEKILSFMKENDADSVRLHSKLFYWEKYYLEPTNFVIDDIRLLKMTEREDNFFLSHGATIWKKEYLLRYLIDGENPWANEIEGSKRMFNEPKNHYMYNIHWHCQPGVAVAGEIGPEGHVYSHILWEMIRMNINTKGGLYLK
jgi:hypothetical protein